MAIILMLPGDDCFVFEDKLIDKFLLLHHPSVFHIQIGHFTVLKLINAIVFLLEDVHRIEIDNLNRKLLLKNYWQDILSKKIAVSF